MDLITLNQQLDQCGNYNLLLQMEKIQLIQHTLKTKVDYPISLKMIQQLEAFFTERKYPCEEYTILAASTYLWSISPNNSQISIMPTNDFRLGTMLQRIKGIQGKRVYVEALIRLIQDCDLQVQDQLKEHMYSVHSELTLPQYYQQIFYRLFSYCSQDKDLALYSFQVLIAIWLKLKFSLENVVPFNGSMVISIIYRCFFFDASLIFPAQQSQFALLLTSILQKQPNPHIKSYYEQKAKQILKQASDGSIVDLRVFEKKDRKRLLQIIYSMQVAFREQNKGNHQALSQLDFFDIQKSPKRVSIRQENTSFTGKAANPFF